ncbi:IgGFc-binding protein [Sorangium sp. So ce367]|uniref:IgGFc-binding protein n=1 Tax=Sorangium sp. So ce367 TaxID=3133305 RepID=UPI003F63A99E
MANMARYRRHAIVGLLAATAGVTGSFAACTDSYRHGLTGSGSGPTGTGGSSGGTGGAGGEGGSTGTFGEGGRCDPVCSNDLKKILSCNGVALETCGPEEGCVNAECVPNPCEAAEKSKSSYGCDYWALKPALRTESSGACFAAFIANTWEKPVHIKVERDGVELPVATFAGIPSGQGQVEFEPYNEANGLGVGEIAILFLSRRNAGGTGLPACPLGPAIASNPATGETGETGVDGTGIGSAFHITTDYPVVAYQIVPYGGSQSAVTSASLLLPTSAWDTNYIAVNAYKSSEPLVPGGNPSLEILANQDNTKVTILPKVAILGGNGVAGASEREPVTYTLDAGQFLQIVQPEELTGSPILSDKPIGVFGGSSCMLVPDVELDCDSGHQQLAPIKAMGNEYAAVRYRNRGQEEESPPWRLVGAVDGTKLEWIPTKPDNAPDELNLGEVVEFNSPGQFVVRSQDANHPFYLGSYMTGGFAYDRVGDPDWINVIPPSQYLDYYVLFTDPTYPETSLVVVRTRSKFDQKFADVTLDCLGESSEGGAITGWESLGQDYEYARIDLVKGRFENQGNCANGRHVMSSALPFGVTVWGWGAFDPHLQVSYAYPAGAGFQPINNVVVQPVQ